MTAPVDVLAVLDALETVSGIPGDQLQKLVDVREARAAVAELIEAANDIAVNGYGTASIQRLDAALARVTGGAA